MRAGQWVVVIPQPFTLNRLGHRWHVHVAANADVSSRPCDIRVLGSTRVCSVTAVIALLSACVGGAQVSAMLCAQHGGHDGKPVDAERSGPRPSPPFQVRARENTKGTLVRP